MLIGSDRGVLLGDGPYALQEQAVSVAVGDGQGGVVGETGETETRQEEEEGSEVMWLPAGEEPRTILPDEGGRFVGSIHQVAEIEGSPVLVLTQMVREQEAEYLQLHDLDGKLLRRVAQVGVPARTATRVSYATGRFVVTEESEGCGRLFVLDESGAELD
ncbi:MAG: hypothetical protein M3N51_02270, partial [Actinomycetota bacterium]|nr:hypothetical protein [Actinomycetota bacterium]